MGPGRCSRATSEGLEQACVIGRFARTCWGTAGDIQFAADIGTVVLWASARLALAWFSVTGANSWWVGIIVREKLHHHPEVG